MVNSPHWSRPYIHLQNSPTTKKFCPSKQKNNDGIFLIVIFCIIYIINENSMFAIESNSGSPEMQLSASIEVSGVRHFLQVLDVRININQSLALAKN